MMGRGYSSLPYFYGMKIVLLVLQLLLVFKLRAQFPPNPYGFVLVNEKYSIQGIDTVQEMDTVCLGEDVKLVMHIGSATAINRSCFFYAQSDTQCAPVAIFNFFTPGVKEISGVFDYVDYMGNYLHDYQAGFYVYVTYCPPVAQFSGAHTACINDCLVFRDSSQNYPVNYEWHFTGGSPAFWNDKTPPAICYKDTGTFPVTLLVSNPAGTDSTTYYVTVSSGPRLLPVQHAYQLTEGDSVVLPACAYGSSYSWQPQQGIVALYDTAITIQPEEGANYELTVFENGCAVTCNYVVYVKNGLLVPTAFTPNGDGVNDFFRILNTNIKLLNFTIYNRWGEMVFSTADITEGWDGVYKDVPQAMSTFVWTCEYVITKTGKRKSAKGNVTLLR